MKFELAAIIVSAFIATTANGQPHTCGGSGAITYRGSTTVFPVTQKCGIKYTSTCPGITVTGTSTGSSSGVRAACGGRTTPSVETGTDIGNTSREFTEGEVTKVSDNKYKCLIGTQREIYRVPVAIDGLTMIINRNAAVNSDCIAKLPFGLNDKQIRWMFSNLTTLEANTSDIGFADGIPATKKWNEISNLCPAQDVKIIGPSTGFGTHDFFKEILFTGGTAEGFRTAFETFPDNSNALRDRVLNVAWSIGFFGFSFYDANDAPLLAVPVNGITPNKASLEGQTYSLFARRIYSLYWNDETSLAKTKCFSDFTFTKAGTIQVEGTGFLPIPEAEREITKAILPGDCPQPGETEAPTPNPTRKPVCRCFFLFRLFGLCCR